MNNPPEGEKYPVYLLRKVFLCSSSEIDAEFSVSQCQCCSTSAATSLYTPSCHTPLLPPCSSQQGRCVLDSFGLFPDKAVC